jgi:hypothetical protein
MVVLVERQSIGVAVDRAEITHRLAMVFTGVLQLRELKQPVSG